MTLTLLLDLDDTLLGNSQKVFIPAYISALAQRLAPFVPPEKMVQTLLAATRQMMYAGSADRFLEDTFAAAFYPALGLDAVGIRPTLLDFYAQDYPKLRTLTHPLPAAQQLVEQALARGYRVAISTSPLFPQTATLQRLDWAGLSHQQYPFELISTYETFHFAKPDPAYFAEFLAQLGWPEGPILVVGDDIEADVLAAQACGLTVFWTPADPDQVWDKAAPQPPRGSLSDVLDWVDTTPEEQLVPNLRTPVALKTVLRATPAAVDTLRTQQAPAQWNVRTNPGEWCLTEIFCHLRDVEKEVNLKRIEQIRREKNPFISGKNTDSWAEERDYIHQDLLEALSQFRMHRLHLLAALDQLSEAEWQKPIRHAIFGPSTLLELVGIIADHDRIHIRQIKALTQ